MCTYTCPQLLLGEVVVLQKRDRYYSLLSVFCSSYLAVLCENPSKSFVELQVVLVNSCIKSHGVATPYLPAIPGAVPEFWLVGVYC